MLIAVRHIWLDQRIQHDVAVICAAGRIAEIRPLAQDTPDAWVHLATPLLTDLQVNGGGGVMVNTAPTAQGMLAVAQAHHALGTGTILPTVITDAADVIAAAGAAALQVMDDPRIGGLHIEGPHIAPARRGTHSAAHIRPLDQTTVTLVSGLRRAGLPVMITLAPETAAPDLLEALVATGAVVSAGHSAATAAETALALDRGVSCFTHLYNAMPPMTSRAAGIVGAAIGSNAYAGIIADGVHVSWDMLRIAFRARPRPDLMFAVSDAMATVGGPDHFTLYGKRIEVKGGMLINDEGALAGAHLDLRQSLANLVDHVGLSLDQAVPMVSDIPRRVMGLAPFGITLGGNVEDILWMDESFARISLL